MCGCVSLSCIVSVLPAVYLDQRAANLEAERCVAVHRASRIKCVLDTYKNAHEKIQYPFQSVQNIFSASIKNRTVIATEYHKLNLENCDKSAKHYVVNGEK